MTTASEYAPATARFLSFTAIAAGSFFAATFTAFVLLPLDDFAFLSAALVLSTLIGAILQCGASFALPHAAVKGSKLRDLAFKKLLATSGLFGLGVAVICGTLPFGDLVWWGGIVGAATGVQLVCDAYIRARGDLLLLGALNATLHLILLLLTICAAILGTLSAGLFLGSVFGVKLAYVLVVLFQYGWPRHITIARSCFSLSDGLKAQTAVLVLYFLGALDVLLVRSFLPEGATYVALRHFGYGLFLVIVQESAIPLLARHLIAQKKVLMSHILGVGVCLASSVGILTAVLVIGLSMIRTGIWPDVTILAAVCLSLASHSLAVFCYFCAYTLGSISHRPLALVIVVTAALAMASPFLSNISLELIVGTVVTLNLLATALSVSTISHLRQPRSVFQ